MLKKLNNKKGFTLMEMLIVVAIIAVLVAIAIPVFNGALTKSKEAADVANVRALRRVAGRYPDREQGHPHFCRRFPGWPR